MYSSDIEFPDKKIETIIKAPAGKHVIAKINEITNESEIVGEFNDWLEAHKAVDDLNKKREGDEKYAVYNDEGKKTRDHKDVDGGLYPQEK